MQPYGWDGAEYIEHLARLETLLTLRSWRNYTPTGFLEALDGAFPPGLHLLSMPVSALFGHTAVGAARSGSLWLLLLAAIVAGCAWQLARDQRAVAAAGVAVLLLPAAHAFATRYYYDLPMTAVLWGMVALAIWSGDRYPIRGGIGTGLLWFLACTIKWSAIPFGPPMLLGATLTPTALESYRPLRRGLFLLVAAATTGACVALYLRAAGTSSSLAVMLEQMWGGLGEASTGAAADPSGVLAWVREHGSLLGNRLGSEKALWYPIALGTALWSPLGAAWVAFLSLPWLATGPKGILLLLCTAVGQWVFLVAFVPILDERFLLTMAPGLALSAGLGWARLPKRLGHRVAVLAVLSGLAVGLEFHFGLPVRPTHPTTLTFHSGSARPEARPGLIPPDEARRTEQMGHAVPPLSVRGLGLADSVAQRGWASRRTGLDADRQAEEILWATLSNCSGDLILLGPSPIWPDKERGVDSFWLRSRQMEAWLQHSQPDRTLIESCSTARIADLAITEVLPGREPDASTCMGTGRQWTVQARVRKPGEDSDLAIWAPRGAAGCRKSTATASGNSR